MADPVLTAPASETIQQGSVTAISGLSLSEAGATAGETFTVILRDSDGDLGAVANGATLSGSGSTVLEISGSLDAVNAALATVTDTDAHAGADPVVISATDSFNNAAQQQTIAVAVTPLLPVLTAPANETIQQGSVTAISGLSLSEAGATAGETFTVILRDSDGDLGAVANGATLSGSPTVLEISGSLDAVNAALATATDTDARAGADPVVISATDSFNNAAQPQTIAVAVTPLLPVLTAPANETIQQGSVTAISGLSLSEAGATAGETFVVHLRDSDGDLGAVANGATLSGSGSTVLEISGSLDAVNAALATVTDTDAHAGADPVVISATDSFNNAAQQQTIAVAVTPLLPVLTAPANETIQQGSVTAISGLSLSEAGATAGETFTVILRDSDGDLGAVANGATLSGSGSTVLEISGSLDAVNAALATATDTDARAGADPVVISATDSFNNAAQPQTIAVAVTPLLPVLTAPANETIQQGSVTAISGLSLSEAGATAGETFVVHLRDSDGDLGAVANGATLSGSGSTVLEISGSLDAVNAALATVTDTDAHAGADPVVISATDSFNNAAQQQTIAVAVTPLLPVLTAPANETIQQGSVTAISGLSLSEAGATAGETFTVILRDSDGDLGAVANGATLSGNPTVLEISGSLNAVNAALATVTDTNATIGLDPIVLTATDSFGNTAQPQTIAANAILTLSQLAGEHATIDWSSLEASLRPASIDTTDWTLIWDRFIDQVGTTTDSLLAALTPAAATLSAIGQPTNDVATLVSYELLQASGAFPDTTLAATTDLAPAGTGLDLSLTRTYSSSLLNRDNPGVFGDGWTFTYGISAVTDASGNVYIVSPSGSEFFTRRPDGSYSPPAGDGSTLTLVDGAYVHTDTSGTIENFLPTGQLGSITDSNGDTIDISYNDNGVVSGVTSSNGQSLTFTTNAAGRITSATDQTGRQITYTYDTTGDQLVSVSGPLGTTTYSYDSSGNPETQNALTQITNPDDTTRTFQYDSEGSLTSSSISGDGETTYSFPNTGTVTETDASGNATTLTYDTNGNLAETEDALGNTTQYQYDSAGQLTQLIIPTGGTSSYTYNSDGNLLSYTDPNGGVVSATYVPGTDLLASLTDQDGNTTDYTYSAAGDLTGITYDDGDGTSYQYSANGLLTSSTNARGETTTYQYNPVGLLTRESFSDGTYQAYTYNAQGELVSAQATSGGITTYGYNAAGELTSITNPSGQVESYTYNSAGQELTRTESDGSVTQYTYNAAGQLAELQDGSGNLITQYTYNDLGQLTSSLDGNGQTTTYQCNGDGNITEIVTKTADGTITSQLDYTYDTDGQPISVTSLDGTWTYAYDGAGQLTSAVFASSNESIPDQNLTYEYDAAGNRTETIFNGAVNDYTTNGLNQYTSVDGTTYDYDADGNVVSVTQSGTTTTYTYNSLNQLTAVTGPGGADSYEYDALGNMVSSTDNGVTSNYIIDPLAVYTSATGPLSAVAQIYNGAGSVTATYDYGNGPAAEINNGTTSYINLDAASNVTSLSGSDGALTANYNYMPYGSLLASTGDVNNFLQYSGGLGAVTVLSGLVDMRARYYDPATGRFLTEDPVGILGGTNAYEYALNDPTSYADPLGEFNVGSFANGLKDIIAGIDYASDAAGAAAQGALVLGLLGASPEIITAGAFVVSAGLLGYGLYKSFEGGREIGDSIINSNSLEIGDLNAFLPGPPNFKESFGQLEGSFYNFLFDLISPPPLPPPPSPTEGVAGAFGCPHFTTFDGLEFDFQGAGEFIAAKSTQPGNTFQVQIRVEPEFGVDSSVSIITQIAVQVGSDRVTFDPDRAADNGPGTYANPVSGPGDDQVVWVDGAPASISLINPALTLPGGTITEVSQYEYQVTLTTGEVVTINPYGDGMGFSVALATTDGPGSVQGFLGSDEGQANDFQLPDGTVLQQPLTQDQLYQTFANAWRVTDATSLLDYAPGQTTATFTDTEYPREILTLSDFPPDLVAQAAAVVKAAGITDPTLAADAEFDYITMGNPSFISEDASIAALTPDLIANSTPAVITQPITPPPSIGILAADPQVTETSGGPTEVTFIVNLTTSAASDTVVDYTVMPDGAGATDGRTYLDAADFGAILPSGAVTIAAGQTEAVFSVNVSASAIGAATDKWLMVGVTSPDGNLVYDPTAQTDILNDQPVAGPPAIPVIELLPGSIANGEVLTQSGTNYTLNLGQVLLNSSLPPLQFAIANLGTPSADGLSSEITGVAGTGFDASGKEPTGAIGAGSAYQDLYITPQTTSLGSYSESLSVVSNDMNDTGYAASLPAMTLTVTDRVVASIPCFVAGTHISAARGEVLVEDLREGDLLETAIDGPCAPIIWIGCRTVDCSRHPSPRKVWPVRIRAHAFAPGMPARDLWLSPDHAVYFADVLIPVKYLIDGEAIAQVPMGQVTYYHLELPRHDVILAEGLPAETFLDTGGRQMFANGGGPVAVHPDFAIRRWEAEGCAPLIVTGQEVIAARQILADRREKTPA